MPKHPAWVSELDGKLPSNFDISEVTGHIVRWKGDGVARQLAGGGSPDIAWFPNRPGITGVAIYGIALDLDADVEKPPVRIYACSRLQAEADRKFILQGVRDVYDTAARGKDSQLIFPFFRFTVPVMVHRDDTLKIDAAGDDVICCIAYATLLK